MTKEEIQLAIEMGMYNYQEDIPGMGVTTLSVNGEFVSVDRAAKTATYCVTFDVTDSALRELDRRILEYKINEKKSELSALEIQLEKLDEED